ncbi:hypothetical protein NL108_014426 [Boleophthalmus pectinirostris]|nr:hypothetical protein NL108_014426 [Boleophthalmus pectinirostris]
MLSRPLSFFSPRSLLLALVPSFSSVYPLSTPSLSPPCSLSIPILLLSPPSFLPIFFSLSFSLVLLLSYLSIFSLLSPTSSLSSSFSFLSSFSLLLLFLLFLSHLCCTQSPQTSTLG